MERKIRNTSNYQIQVVQGQKLKLTAINQVGKIKPLLIIPILNQICPKIQYKLVKTQNQNRKIQKIIKMWQKSTKIKNSQ